LTDYQEVAMTMRFASLAAAFAVAMAVPAWAHHGWGGYQNTEMDVTGKVESVNLGGPHASLKVRGSDGNMWDVVLSPPNTTFSAGIKEGTIPVGAEVTAHGHRHRDMNKFEIKTEQLSMGEKTFNVYPGRD
jgi:hypothetical protein